MKKKTIIYALVLPLVVVSVLAFANRKFKNDTEPIVKPLKTIDNKARLDERKKWEASPDGLEYKKWEASALGKKVYASYDKIKPHINAFSNIEAVVTSTTFLRDNAKSTSPKWLIVKFDGEEYMMQFNQKDFEKLSSLKVNDKIIIKSHSAGFSPNHPYLIVSGDYIEHNKKVIFTRDFNSNKDC